MATLEEYLNLITSQHRDKPKFIAMVTKDLSLPIQVQELFQSMIPKFDIDLAVGQQLDVLGQWIGVSRDVSIPITGIYFSWDGVDPYVGWNYGSWEDTSQPATITTLPDDAYLTLLRARIAANQWNGTTEGAYAIWDAVFPQINILIQDNQDMSYDLAFVGGIVDSLTLALLTGGYIPIKPEGVRVNSFFIPVDDNPLFAWDIENDNLAGWDDGSWAREIPAT